MTRMIYNILIVYTICMFTGLTSGMLYRLTVRPDRLVCEQEGKSKMDNKQIMLTDEGLLKLEQELENLRTKKRKEVAEKIKIARGFGDLSENSEYDAAKEEQAQVEARIVQLENMLKNAKVIDNDDIDLNVVSIGTRVTVYDEEFEEEQEYSIVGSTEADPDMFRISDESPVGRALIGRNIGDIVDVETPGGVIKFKILSIDK